MDPATAAALTATLKDGGPWALVALLIMAVGYLLKGWMKCFEARVAEGSRVAAALERASQTSATVSAALESRTGYFERLGEKVDDASRASALNQQIIITKLDGLGSRV